jgi:hypothetical protein
VTTAPPRDEPMHDSSPIRGWLRKWRGPGWRRWVKWALVVLAAVAILFLVAMNVFLKTRLFRNLVSFDPEALVIDYDSASSFFPGRVHGKNVSIRGKDHQVEWKLTLEEVDFTFAPTELFHRRFHATRVRGSGVVFRARQRIAPGEATPEYLSALPAIDGLEAVPLKEPTEKPPPTDAEYHLWSAQLDDVVAEGLHELWIDQVRYTGDARVVGGFELRPIRWVRVGPATVTVRSGEIHTAAPTVIRDMSGTIHCMIHGFDPRNVHGIDLLRQVTLHVLVDGVVPNLDFIDRVGKASGTRVSGGGGAAHVDVTLDAGKLQTGTSVQLESEGARVESDGLALSGSARTKLAVLAGEARVDVAASALGVRRDDETAPLFTARAIDASAASRSLDVAELFADPAYVVDVAGGELPDLRLFDKYFAKDDALHVEGGHGALHGHAEIGGAAAKGTAVLALDDAAVRLKGARLRGNVTAGFNLARGNRRELDLSGTRVDLSGLMTGAAKDAAPWSGRLDFPSARVKVEGGPAFTGSMVATCRDARPLVALIAAADTPLPSWAAGLVSSDAMKATAQLHASAGRTYLRGLRAKVGAFEIGADSLKEGPRVRSLFLVQRAPFALGIDARDGSSKVVLLDATGWFEKAEAELPKL